MAFQAMDHGQDARATPDASKMPVRRTAQSEKTQTPSLRWMVAQVVAMGSMSAYLA